MKRFFLAILVSVFTWSCNDRAQEGSFMQSAENQRWIEKAKALLDTKDKGARGMDWNSGFQLNWEKAAVFENKKGHKSVSVPFRRNTPRDVNPELQLNEHLLVSYDGKDKVADMFILQAITGKNKEKYSPDIVKSYDRDRVEGFTGKLIVKPIGSEISEGRVFTDGKAAGKVFASKKTGTLKNTRANGIQCWEVYLITYYSDGTTTEETLYYYCEDDEDQQAPEENGGGSSGNPEPPEECVLDLSGVHASSELVSENLISEDILERRKLYTWKVVVGPTYWINSNDIGVHRRANTSSPWKWHSFTHSSLTLGGHHFGIGISPTTTYSNAVLGEYWANMALKVHVTFSIICVGFPFPSHSDFESNMNFSIHGGY